MKEEQVIAFIQAHIKSVWALELLILLAADRNRVWTADDLVRYMRSSAAAVEEAIRNLDAAAVLEKTAEGGLRFAPPSPDLDQLIVGAQNLYATKPATVVRAIMTAQEDRLRIFADAFKFRKE